MSKMPRKSRLLNADQLQMLPEKLEMSDTFLHVQNKILDMAETDLKMVP